jgi:hypothetical protein
MKVKILKKETNVLVDAEILDSKSIKINLPSITDGWCFNFRKKSRLKGYETYVLICEETPEIIEGCLIFEMQEVVGAYMAFIEVAPHNRYENKKYHKVAGSLIAFACRMSFIRGDEESRGYLTFEVIEEEIENKEKLISMYINKYKALYFGQTTLVITPEGSEQLINEFLNY